MVGRLALKPPSRFSDLDGPKIENYLLENLPIEVKFSRRPVEGNRPYRKCIQR